MTRIVSPGMVKRKRGAIINISSLAHCALLKEAVTYSSTKEFINQFSKILSLELEGTGVSVQTVCPGVVATKINHLPADMLCPTPEYYVNNALHLFGVEEITYGFIPHAIFAYLFGTLPKSLHLRLTKHFVKGFQDAFIKSIRKVE